jgi:hypothetical protein
MIVIALSIFTSLILPLYAVSVAWGSRNGGRLTYVLKAIAALGFMGFLALIVPWHWLTSWLQWFWWAAIVLCLVAGLVAMRDQRWIEGEKRGTLVATAFEPIIGLGLLGYVALGLLPGDATEELAFPLQGGRFVVAQGGNNAMLNYHNPHPEQRYALDILALDDLGRRGDGIQPTSLAAYLIHGIDVVSPCAGDVVMVEDGIAENAIGATNTEQAAGNHITLRCNGLNIELAHFIPGSISVAAGDAVAVGQRLGKVGNSGNSSEPHLHIHATRGEGAEAGAPVPLTFGGRFLVRNAIVEA